LPFRSSVSQKSTRSGSRRSGKAAIDRRKSAQVIATVSVNHANSAISLETQVKGTMARANAGKYLY
jgi:hypothetical protein